MAVNQISEQGRATQGVKLIRVDEGDEIAAITQLDEEEVEIEMESSEDLGDEASNADQAPASDTNEPTDS